MNKCDERRGIILGLRGNALKNDEIDFLHAKGCKIAAIYKLYGDNKTTMDGISIAHEIGDIASILNIPKGKANFVCTI